MNYQDKIIRQFWGKLIRHFSKVGNNLQIVTWGGGCLTNQNGSLATFFHNVRRIE